MSALTRFAKGRVMNVSGTAQNEPWNKWRSEAWRMEIVSLNAPPKSASAGPVTQIESEEEGGGGASRSPLGRHS